MRLLKKLTSTTTEKKILIVLACLCLGYWWMHSYVWFHIDDHKISINGRSLAKGSDYSCFKSLSGDIFCSHQDHGTQYFISPRNNEVSAISEDVLTLDLVDVILISGGAHNGFENSGGKQRLSDSKLVVGNGFVEFAPSVTEFRGSEIERWRISY